MSFEWMATIVISYWISNFAMYLVIAGGFYLYLWVLRRRAWQPRRIQKSFPESSRLWAEIGWSASSALVFSAMMVPTAWLISSGYTPFYEGNEHGYGYFLFSYVALLLLHDTWFYWTHRLLHLRPIFRIAHAVHHRSVNPSPWSAFAFHPLEAVVHAVLLPLAVLLLPLNIWAISLWFTTQVVVNVLGHKGYEFLPASFARLWLFRLLNTSTHHNMHHRLTKCNFGIYLNVWDRIMGTNHPDYQATFEAPLAQKSGTRAVGTAASR